jgi:integrase
MGSIFRPKYKDRHGKERTSSKWWIQYYSRGRKIREATDTTDLVEAKDKLKKREGEAVDEAPSLLGKQRVKFSELAQLEIDDYKANKRKTLNDLQIRLDKHLLPFFGHLKASQISPADVKRYIVNRQEEGAKNGTINRELTAIVRAFSLGMDANMIKSVPKVKMLEEDNVRKGFFQREQLEVVLKHLRPHNQNPARFGFITGWRKQEILGIRWPQVDFKAGTVCLEPGTTKNKKARIFPFISELREILEEQRAKADALKKNDGVITPWVFFIEEKGKRKGRPIGDFKKNWNSACEKAGIPGRIFHDFRRTAVRNLVRAGIPERVAMQLTGHKTRDIFERYNIVSEGDLADAAVKLESFQNQSADKDTDKVKGLGRTMKAVNH